MLQQFANWTKLLKLSKRFRIAPLKQCSPPKPFCIFHKAAQNNHKVFSENTWCKHNYQLSEGRTLHGDERLCDKMQEHSLTNI